MSYYKLGINCKVNSFTALTSNQKFLPPLNNLYEKSANNFYEYQVNIDNDNSYKLFENVGSKDIDDDELDTNGNLEINNEKFCSHCQSKEM